MSGASVIIHKQNKYIKIFNKLGALDEAHAITLDEAGIRKSYIFNRMITRGVFIECENGKFYIDDDEVFRFKDSRRRRGLLALIACLALVAICYFAGIK